MTDGDPHLTDLDDSLLAPLDGFAEVFFLMTLQTLVEQLLERVHGIIHLLQQKTYRDTHIKCLEDTTGIQCYCIIFVFLSAGYTNKD